MGILAIPLALPGVMTGLLVFGLNISIPVFVGMMLLAGITVNNSVLLLSDIPPSSGWMKVFRLSRKKIASIILTALTAVSGIMPLMFTGGGESPFAVTVVFGLISSTILTVLILPILAADKNSTRSTID